ncbi:MAG: DegT/DnrJ/EryC1/StrS family aminotransferase [Proteobacteria bacterium]|nr:DegT/DnrJ/EryC1/StrS family aminotransferase [Pseudomonadota bacterium]MBU1688245.1 DegT/DnrJ/EryC1/StrS family aminotransferase [Pseudomonadota bacterium]
MKVPLLDLGIQLAGLREKMVAAVTEVIDSTCYIMGPKVEALEEEVARYCGSPFGIGVASGTDALLASLMALGVGPGDLVLTTPYSFFATMGAVLRLGARPLFVDIDPVSYNIDPVALEQALAEDPARTARIKVVLPVHLYGQCADMAAIMKVADHYTIPVLEDAAQAIGAACPMVENGRVVWRRAGSIGVAGCFSFFPSKNLGGVGDGGMITCQDPQLTEKIKIIRVHGGAPKYHHGVVGGNFRLDPIQAAVLSVKLPELDGWHQARRDNAALYNRLFDEVGLAGDQLTLPIAVYRDSPREAGAYPDYHIYNQYVLRVKNREKLMAFMANAGIGVEIYYPIPLHRQQCLAGYGYERVSYPESERAARETMALPIYPELTDAMQEYVVDRIAAFYADPTNREM